MAVGECWKKNIAKVFNMAHKGNSSLLEALDTSAEKDDQGYGTGYFGFESLIDSDDCNDSPAQSSPGNLDEEDTEEDDVVLVEDTLPEDSGHKVTKRASDFKESFSKDYKIPRKTKDSDVVETSPVLPEKVGGYSSPLHKAQYAPCNIQYSPRTQNTSRINSKLQLTGKKTFNSYREDQEANLIHVTSTQTNSISFNRIKHTPQDGQKLSVHVPSFSTVAVKPRIVVDNHEVSSTVHTLSNNPATSANVEKHRVNTGGRNSCSSGATSLEDSDSEVTSSNVTSTVMSMSGTGDAPVTVSTSNVQIKLQHDKGQLSGGEVVNAINTGGLQGGGRGMLAKGRGAAVQNSTARGGAGQGFPVRRGRGRPSKLKGNAIGMNMISSARVNLGERCDAGSTVTQPNPTKRQTFQDAFTRGLQVGNMDGTVPETAAEEMRNVLSPPTRLGSWRHAEVERKVVPSTTQPCPAQNLQNGKESQDTEQDSRSAELGTEEKEQGAFGETEEEEEDEGNVLFLCQNCGHSTYHRDRCNGCGKGSLKKIKTNHDPLKPQPRAPLSRKGIQSANFYRDQMSKFSNIFSPGTVTTTTNITEKQPQKRLYQPTTRRNTRNAGRPVGRPRVVQKEVEIVLISDDEEETPKPSPQPESSPASRSSSRANTPVPEPDTKLPEADTKQDVPDSKLMSDSPVIKQEGRESPSKPPGVKPFITDAGKKSATFAVRALRFGSRLVQPCEVITSNIEKGICFRVEGQNLEVLSHDIVQSVAHFGNVAPFIQLSVTPKVGLAVRSRLRFNKQKGTDWFDPGSSDASEKYIILLLHTPLSKTAIDVLRQHLQAFASEPDSGFVEVEDKDKANNILMTLEVKEPAQKFENTTFITTQSVLYNQGPSNINQTASAVPRGPSTSSRGQSAVPKPTYSQRKVTSEDRLSLPDTRSRSSSPFDKPTDDKDDSDRFVGPVTKLVVYPPPPATGGIAVTKKDLACLEDGELVNDVIIDFYLKYLVSAMLSDEDRKRTHIFSSFFYKRLMQKDHVRTRSVEDTRMLPMHRRHNRVRTWTRHVDLFSKDFVIVPINENSHWFLVVICFPGLDKQDPHSTLVPRLTRPPTPDPPTLPPTPATDPQLPTQSTDESGSGCQQSQSRGDSTGEERSQAGGHDTARPCSSQSSVKSHEGQEESGSQNSSTKGIQTEPLTREQIEAAIASQLQEEIKIQSPQSSKQGFETMEKVSLSPRRSSKKCSETASCLADSSSCTSSQQSSPSRRSSPRKKTEESPRHSLEGNEARSGFAMSTTSPRKRLKFEAEEQGDTEEKMDVDQCSGDQTEGGSERMETDQSISERRKEPLQGEPMETETSASAIDTTQQGSCDQATMDDSASDQSGPAMSDQSAPATSDQSLPNMSIRRRPCILLFDSIRGPRRAHVIKNLREYLTVEWEERKKDQPKREFDNNHMKAALPKVPQQPNCSDCGVFLLQYVETFFSNPIQDYSFPLSGLEHWFSMRIMEQKRQELQNLIHKLRQEQQDMGKGDEKT